MRTHTSQFKNEIKEYGRQFNDNIYYNNTTYNGDHIFSVNYSVDTTLCKSVMQTLTIDTDISMNVGDTLDYGISVEGANDEIRFNGFIVNKIEEQKDKKSNLVTCYDNMINTMKDYETPKVNGVAITYPITVRNYLSAICSHLGITFKNSSDTFTNYDKNITSEHYVDTDGNNLGYTFRDVLDDLAEAIGSFICIDNNGQLEIKGFTNTQDTINEEYFKDKNVNVGKKIGPYNVVVLSREDVDNLYYPSTLPSNPIEFKITDNPVLDQTNREDFIQGIYNKINGLEFYLNDFATNGILYYEIGDKYNVSIGNTTYPCLMLSDDIKRTTGLKENVITKEPKQSVTEFKYASPTDRAEKQSRNAYIKVDKAQGQIDQIVTAVGDNGQVTTASIVQSINDSGSQIKLNGDKIYINGVTFDQNQKMTMTDGDIEIIDNGTGILGDSHITITSADGTKLAFLTSRQFKITTNYSANGVDYIKGSWINDGEIALENHSLDNTEASYTFMHPSYIQFNELTPNEQDKFSYDGAIYPNGIDLGWTDNNYVTHNYFRVYKDQTTIDGTTTINGNTTMNGTHLINTPTDVWSGLEIRPSNRNESSIAYHNAFSNTRAVAGCGTASFDGYGIYMDDIGSNALTIDRQGNVIHPFTHDHRKTFYLPFSGADDAPQWFLLARFNKNIYDGSNLSMLVISGTFGGWASGDRTTFKFTFGDRNGYTCYGYQAGNNSGFNDYYDFEVYANGDTKELYLHRKARWVSEALLDIQGEDIEIFNSSTPTSPSGTLVYTIGSWLPNISQLNEVVLYNDDTGTNGNVTLSESAGNFRCLEIYYRVSNNHNSTKIYNANGKETTLSVNENWISGNNRYLNIRTKNISINGNTITSNRNDWTQILNTGVNAHNSSNDIYITRVVGYRW